MCFSNSRTTTHGNDRQVRRQAALAAKAAEQGQVVVDDRQKEFGGQILFVLGGEPQRPQLGGVANHMQHEPQETVDEVLPSPRLVI